MPKPLLNFYPGPSKIYPEVGALYQEAIEQQFFEYNHRSPQFEKIFKHTTAVLHAHLNIPTDYNISFVSSATESWQLILQSFVKCHCTHIYNGAFGQKWNEKAYLLGLGNYEHAFDEQSELDVDNLRMPANTELIALTQNETSNGTQISNATIKAIKEKYPEQLLAIDATSSMAGVELDWCVGDIWFSSVQKCFGLPAGMCVMVCSPQAVNKAIAMNNRMYYNNFVNIFDNTGKLQTTHTPNIANIYLLGKVLESKPNITEVSRHIKTRAQQLYNFIDKREGLQSLIKNQKVKSDTVICIEGTADWVKRISQKAKQSNILLGKGYGSYKDFSLRIANFPAIPNSNVDLLMHFLAS